jgi:hypothetical protein
MRIDGPARVSGVRRHLFKLRLFKALLREYLLGGIQNLCLRLGSSKLRFVLFSRLGHFDLS